MQAEVARIAREHGLALLGPNCMGVIDLTPTAPRTSATSRRTCRAAASPGSPSRARSPTPSSTPATGSASRGSSAAGRRSSSTCATTWPTASTTPRRARSSCSSRGSSGPSGSSPWPTARSSSASRSWRSRSAGATRRRPRRWPTPGSLAGEARVTDAALDAAGVIRCRDLDELLETAELVEGVRRTGRRVGRGRTGRRDRLDRRGVAHRRPRAADRARPAADPAVGAGRRSSRRCRRWATSATRSTRGARPTRRRPTAPCFEAMAASGAYDVLVLVHDFPYRSLPSEVATANEVTSRAPGGDRATARRSCRSTCR